MLKKNLVPSPGSRISDVAREALKEARKPLFRLAEWWTCAPRVSFKFNDHHLLVSCHSTVAGIVAEHHAAYEKRHMEILAEGSNPEKPVLGGERQAQ